MNIIDSINDQVDRFEVDHGQRPKLIRLGRNQSAALRTVVSKCDGGPVSAADRMGRPNFDGIEIQEVEADDHLSVSDGDDPG